MPHQAGQHYDVRLTAPDGYQAQRSYSIASSPEQKGEIELTVERLEEGEVSTYLHDVLIVGDQVELRGPIGGYFVWEASMGGPLLLVAGGSGIVPLMAMIRHRHAVGSKVPVRLLYSSRTYEDIIYRDELERLHKDRYGSGSISYPDTWATAWLGWLWKADRYADAGGGCQTIGEKPQGIYLRSDCAGGGGGQWVGDAWHPDRTRSARNDLVRQGLHKGR